MCGVTLDLSGRRFAYFPAFVATNSCTSFELEEEI
jgi:hypothetical protein